MSHNKDLLTYLLTLTDHVSVQ